MSEIEGGVVYLLTSPSGKRYVGQTWNLPERLRTYAKKRWHYKSAIRVAVSKYGWDNFQVAVLACGIQTQDALDKTEMAFIALLETLAPAGYNLMSGGRGGKHSTETRAKLRVANLGKSPSLETRAKISAANTGRKHTAEARANMSAAQKGKTKSAEHIAKLAAALKGKPGIPHTVEARTKIGNAHRGKVVSTETRAKLRAINLGKTHSPETRAKMSASQSARWSRNR